MKQKILENLKIKLFSIDKKETTTVRKYEVITKSDNKLFTILTMHTHNNDNKKSSERLNTFISGWINTNYRMLTNLLS